jgi:hypothetical protein
LVGIAHLAPPNAKPRVCNFNNEQKVLGDELCQVLHKVLSIALAKPDAGAVVPGRFRLVIREGWTAFTAHVGNH